MHAMYHNHLKESNLNNETKYKNKNTKVDKRKIKVRMASSGDEDQVPPGDPVTVSTLVIDAGTTIMQRRLPVKQMNTHVSTFAIYGGDMSRQIETHHYVHRVNDEFLQCAVFASDRSDAPLIGTFLFILYSHRMCNFENL